MRTDPVSANRPLWQLDDTNMSPAAGATTPDTFQYAATDYNRSPYFRYQGLQKLAGTTTTHSNVFAIWITVGYFEVTPATTAITERQWTWGTETGTIYPGGYQLGRSRAPDTGGVTCAPRAFASSIARSSRLHPQPGREYGEGVLVARGLLSEGRT